MLAIRAGQMFDGERFTDGRVTVLLDDSRVHALALTSPLLLLDKPLAVT